MTTIRCDLSGNIREADTNENMEHVGLILQKLDTLFLDLGFKPVEVEFADTQVRNFMMGNLYCKPQYGWAGCSGFFVEYADSLDEAIKNLYEDGECFPLELGEAAILEYIRAELLHETAKQRENESSRKTA